MDHSSNILDLGWKESVFWPIIVEGRSQEDEWAKADREAAGALHRLASLVSLAWNEPFQVRVGPQLASTLPPRLPDDWMAPRDSFLGANPQIGMRDEQPLPGWLQEAWRYLDNDDRAGDAAAALSLWHEGLLLQPEHPSFALVAFVASVEQVDKVLQPATSGSAARFWKALGQVTPASDLAALRKPDVYKLRSSTAHGSRVHGLETIFGAVVPPPPLSTISPDPLSHFVHRTVPQMAKAARALLIRMLAA